MTVVFLYGPPAAGKLTIATELERRVGFRLFHNHLTVGLGTLLFDFGDERFVRLVDRLRLDRIGQTVAVASASGRDSRVPIRVRGRFLRERRVSRRW